MKAIWMLALLAAADGRSAVEDLKLKLREAKSLAEKAEVLRSLASDDLRDPALVQAVAKHLAPCGSDYNLLVPTAAAETMGRCRGSAAASRALSAACGAYRKNPYMLGKIRAALGRVGHESGLAAFQEDLEGNDPAAAVAAIRAIAEFPAPVAFEALLREGEKSLKRGEDGGEALKALQKVSGEKYPTVPEFGLWWKKRGAAIREEAARRGTEPPGPPAAAGPALIVELLFRENTGTTTLNTGASCGAFPSASLTGRGPAWTGSTPINAGPAALEWTNGAQAVDLGGAGFENLKNLKSFTLTGWLLATDLRESPGGNRILSWLHPSKAGEGVELVLRSDGGLQLGIHQPAESSPLRTPPAQIPALDPKAKDLVESWRFFAVVVEPTGVEFYVGSWNGDARRVARSDSARGTSGARIAPHLTIGNVPPAIRAGAPRGFRGILDEIRIFGTALGAEEVIRVQNRQTPTP